MVRSIPADGPGGPPFIASAAKFSRPRLPVMFGPAVAGRVETIGAGAAGRIHPHVRA
jgi:hypothetical protein